MSALIIPGIDGSSPEHWQTRWERERADCVRVDQRDWHDPEPLEWVVALDRAIRSADRPVVLVAHSLGCLLVDHAAALFGDWQGRVRAALLVAPCDPERPCSRGALARFSPAHTPLPFRSIVVASRDDPYIGMERARCFAERWGASFVDAGAAGHMNAQSELGSWRFGQVLLDELLRSAAVPKVAVQAAALRAATLERTPQFGCTPA